MSAREKKGFAATACWDSEKVSKKVGKIRVSWNGMLKFDDGHHLIPLSLTVKDVFSVRRGVVKKFGDNGGVILKGTRPGYYTLELLWSGGFGAIFSREGFRKAVKRAKRR